MSCYTLSNCLLDNLELDKKYISDVLMVFTQSNPFKVALDKSNRILDIYAEIAGKNETVATWLNLMTMKPTSFETINVDVISVKEVEEIFLKVCSSTKSQQKVIVSSHERWTSFKYFIPQTILYDNIQVKVYDRDEAIPELHPPTSNTSITATNSTVAMDGSKIEDSKNINK